MNRNLIYYFIICILDFVTIHISAQMLIDSIIESSIWGTLIFSLLFALTVDKLIDRRRNFVKYYPNFEDKWLKPF